MDSTVAANALGDEQWSAAAAHHRLAGPVPLPLPDRGDVKSNLVVSKALTNYQVHHWYHSRSCFKASRRTPSGKICRMFFPKEAVADTRWTVHDKVVLRRDIGSEYLNTYIPLVNSVFKCNHDVKFLTAAEGTTARIASVSSRSNLLPRAVCRTGKGFLHDEVHDKRPKHHGEPVSDPWSRIRQGPNARCRM